MQEADLIRLKRDAKAKGGFYVEPEAKVVFVVSAGQLPNGMAAPIGLDSPTFCLCGRAGLRQGSPAAAFRWSRQRKLVLGTSWQQSAGQAGERR